MPKSSIGDQELLLLHYIDDRGGGSVGEVAAGFGESSGLARSTVLTMMERLRAKGYLKRKRVNGVFRYSAATGPREATRGAIGRFVERTLGGSVSPFVAWLSERGEVSDAELVELQALIAKLQRTKRES